MVQCQTPEPSTITPQITDCPISRPELSTLEAGITDGPMTNTGTFHDNAPNHGRFRDNVTTIKHTEATAGRQAGPFPEPGAVLTVCSRRRRFIPAAVLSLRYHANTLQDQTCNNMSQNRTAGKYMMKASLCRNTGSKAGFCTRTCHEVHILQKRLFKIR